MRPLPVLKYLFKSRRKAFKPLFFCRTASFAPGRRVSDKVTAPIYCPSAAAKTRALPCRRYSSGRTYACLGISVDFSSGYLCLPQLSFLPATTAPTPLSASMANSLLSPISMPKSFAWAVIALAKGCSLLLSAAKTTRLSYKTKTAPEEAVKCLLIKL